MLVRNTFISARDFFSSQRNEAWLHFWELKSEKLARNCCSTSCPNQAEIGALMKPTALLTGNRVYVVPLCNTCLSISFDRVIHVKRSIAITLNDTEK